MLPTGSPTPHPLAPDTASPGTMVSPPLSTTEVPPPVAQLQCKEPGWTNWINTNKPDDGDDIEFLQSIVKAYAFCREDQIAYIQCRQVSNGASYDNADDDRTICSTKAGFACYGSLQPDGKCEDYEIRLYCQCSKSGK